MQRKGEKASIEAINRRSGTLPPLGAMAKACDVVGFGENSVDIIAVLEGRPQQDGKQVLASLSRAAGGQVATAMAACARLGCRARYVGAIGDDEEGRVVVAALRRAGVEPHVRRRPHTSTRTAIVLVDARTGSRSVLEHRDRHLPLRRRELDARILTSGRLLLVDGRDVAVSVAAARLARRRHIPVVLDVETVAPGLDELMRLADVIVAAEALPTAFTGVKDTGRALARMAREARAALAVVTLGAAGSLALVAGRPAREIRTRGFRVPVVDTTGAGDTFRGGLMAAWIRAGDGADVTTLLEYANAAAACNCRELGAQAALPTWAEVTRLVTSDRRGQSK
jgi:sugar/nucleoside kinase (ribokinase family)